MRLPTFLKILSFLYFAPAVLCGPVTEAAPAGEVVGNFALLDHRGKYMNVPSEYPTDGKEIPS